MKPAEKSHQGSAGSSGRPAAAGEHAGLAALLAIEDKIRAAPSEIELVHLIANETRKLVAARQILVLRASSPDDLRVVSVSSLALLDRDTPFIRWVEAMIATLGREQGIDKSVDFALPAYTPPDSAETRSYPFGQFLFQPLRLSSGEVFAALLLSRERPWSEQEKKLVARQSSVYSSAWQALHGARQLRPAKLYADWMRPAFAVLACILAIFPVPMTTLAPVEIVARNPHRVTAPIDAVIKEIVAEPNRSVALGDVLFRFEDTTLRNRFALAEREMAVARTRFERAQQAAFSDENARHELAIARSEFELKRAERDYAASLLEQTVVKAERSGVLIYSDKDQWLGRPVRTGERIMQIADPADVGARIEMSVADAVMLDKNARATLFLDSAPLSAVSARLTNSSYHAEPNSTQQLVYRLHAEVDRTASGLRIGARGTAQLSGDRVPFAYFILRRPIAAVRQYFGF